MSETADIFAKLKAALKTERKPRRVLGEHPEPYRILSNYHDKKCRRCGRQFWAIGAPPYSGAYFCSSRCQQDDRNERRREQRALERTQRKRKLGKCAVCGAKLVDQVRSTMRYCGDACRQSAYRSRAAP
jgi:hypothetical protein